MASLSCNTAIQSREESAPGNPFPIHLYARDGGGRRDAGEARFHLHYSSEQEKVLNRSGSAFRTETELRIALHAPSISSFCCSRWGKGTGRSALFSPAQSQTARLECWRSRPKGESPLRRTRIPRSTMRCHEAPLPPEQWTSFYHRKRSLGICHASTAILLRRSSKNLTKLLLAK